MEPKDPGIVNLPESTETCQLLAPRGTHLPVYTEKFSDGSGFAFDPANPRGVEYMDVAAFDSFLIEPRHGERRPSSNHNQAPESCGRRAIASSIKRFSVWLHISNACNLACRYCYIPHLKKAVAPKAATGQFMSASTIEIATRALFEFCLAEGYGELHIKFAGGEPTLDVGRIESTCDLACRMSAHFKMPVSFSMLTNGVFTDKKVFSTVRRYRISISISVDGAPAAHDKLRFVIKRSPSAAATHPITKAGTWEEIEKNIVELGRIGIRPFLLCTIAKINYSTLMEFGHLCGNPPSGLSPKPRPRCVELSRCRFSAPITGNPDFGVWMAGSTHAGRLAD